MINAFATPGDDYLASVGAIAYSVSTMEWMILGDLEGLQGIPGTLTASSLAMSTTGRIAAVLESAVGATGDPAAGAYLRTAGEALKEASAIRNDVLHARPATLQGEQRLYRWRGNGKAAFWVDDLWIEDKLGVLGGLMQDIAAARPPGAQGVTPAGP
jgi:hypothetical protein